MKRFDFFAIPFAMDVAVAMSQLMANFRALDLGASALFVGLILGVGWGAPYVIVAMSTGKTIGRFGARTTATAGAFLFGLGAIVAGMATNPWILLLAGPLSGAGGGIFWPAFQTCLKAGTPTETRVRTSIFNVSWTVGILVGGAVAGHAYRLAGPHAAFWLVGALVMVMTVVVWFRVGPVEGASTGSDLEVADAHVEVSANQRMMAWVSNGAMWTAAAAAGAIFPKFARGLGFSDGAIGEMSAAVWVGQIVLFAVLASGPWWQCRKWPLLLGMAGGAVSMGLFGFCGSAVAFVAAYAILGASRAPTQAGSVHCSLHAGDRSDACMGFHEAILGGGGVVGPVLGGILADQLGVRAPFALGVGVIVLAIALVAAAPSHRAAGALASPQPEPAD